MIYQKDNPEIAHIMRTGFAIGQPGFNQDNGEARREYAIDMAYEFARFALAEMPDLADRFVEQDEETYQAWLN